MSPTSRHGGCGHVFAAGVRGEATDRPPRERVETEIRGPFLVTRLWHVLSGAKSSRLQAVQIHVHMSVRRLLGRVRLPASDAQAPPAPWPLPAEGSGRRCRMPRSPSRPTGRQPDSYRSEAGTDPVRRLPESVRPAIPGHGAPRRRPRRLRTRRKVKPVRPEIRSIRRIPLESAPARPASDQARRRVSERITPRAVAGGPRTGVAPRHPGARRRGRLRLRLDRPGRFPRRRGGRRRRPPRRPRRRRRPRQPREGQGERQGKGKGSRPSPPPEALSHRAAPAVPVPHADAHALSHTHSDTHTHADSDSVARTAVPVPLPDAPTEADAEAAPADPSAAPARAETTGQQARTPPGAAGPRTSDHEAAGARVRAATSATSAAAEPDASAHRPAPADDARPRGDAPLPACLAPPAEDRHLRRHRDAHDHRARGARDGDPAPPVQVTRRPTTPSPL